MSFSKWANSKVKKLEWYEFGLTKVAVLAFALMVAKLWTPVLSLDWYWYAIIAVVAVIKPASRIWSK